MVGTTDFNHNQITSYQPHIFVHENLNLKSIHINVFSGKSTITINTTGSIQSEL